MKKHPFSPAELRHLESTMPEALKKILQKNGEKLETVSPETAWELLRVGIISAIVSDRVPRDLRADLLRVFISCERQSAIFEYLKALLEVSNENPEKDFWTIFSSITQEAGRRFNRNLGFIQNLMEAVTRVTSEAEAPSTPVVTPPPKKEGLH